jgi:Outer membrane protein beta-barrel domain
LFKNAALAMFFLVPICSAQPQGYAGVLGGASTLSADARAVFEPSTAATASYKAENGPTIDAFAGVHWNDYVSLQLDYLWNRNNLTLDALRASVTGAGTVLYERNFRSEQHAVSGNALLYFRPRPSEVRPYLSLGAGFFHLVGEPQTGGITNGINPPGRFSATKPTLLVAVGIDLKIKRGWAFRYSFSETISASPISNQLTPPGTRGFMNFRNLFGFVKTF